MKTQTIDGVPRELLERLLYELPNERTKGDLRALLDASQPRETKVVTSLDYRSMNAKERLAFCRGELE